MRVLMLSTDKNILDKDSEAGQRMVEYGRLVDKLDILLVQKSNILSILKKGKKLERPDLITTQDPFEIGFLGWRLAKFFKTKLQLQIHTDFKSPYFWKESLLNKIRVILAKFLLPRADCIRTVSKRILSSSDLDNLTVLPIWVDTEKIKNTSIKTSLREKYPQFDFIILMASRITKEKNIKMAIDVIKEFPKVGLVIVGDGLEKDNLKFKIENLKLRDRVILEPWSGDLASYYKTADLFLLTSNYEGYGRTLIEAATADCKIISTDVGVANEILEPENIFKPGNKNALKEKIEQAIKGNIKSAKQLHVQTKEEYLKKYKESWLGCLRQAD